MKGNELKIKKKVNTLDELKQVIEEIENIEEEYNCKCTLLEVEITH